MKTEFTDPEEVLNAFQSLQGHPGYRILMGWVEDCYKDAFQKLSSSKDPTELAKTVGTMVAFAAVRKRIDTEIESYISSVEKKKP